MIGAAPSVGSLMRADYAPDASGLRAIDLRYEATSAGAVVQWVGNLSGVLYRWELYPGAASGTITVKLYDDLGYDTLNGAIAGLGATTVQTGQASFALSTRGDAPALLHGVHTLNVSHSAAATSRGVLRVMLVDSLHDSRLAT